MSRWPGLVEPEITVLGCCQDGGRVERLQKYSDLFYKVKVHTTAKQIKVLHSKFYWLGLFMMHYALYLHYVNVFPNVCIFNVSFNLCLYCILFFFALLSCIHRMPINKKNFSH